MEQSHSSKTQPENGSTETDNESHKSGDESTPLPALCTLSPSRFVNVTKNEKGLFVCPEPGGRAAMIHRGKFNRHVKTHLARLATAELCAMDQKRERKAKVLEDAPGERDLIRSQEQSRKYTKRANEKAKLQEREKKRRAAGIYMLPASSPTRPVPVQDCLASDTAPSIPEPRLRSVRSAEL